MQLYRLLIAQGSPVKGMEVGVEIHLILCSLSSLLPRRIMTMQRRDTFFSLEPGHCMDHGAPACYCAALPVGHQTFRPQPSSGPSGRTTPALCPQTPLQPPQVGWLSRAQTPPGRSSSHPTSSPPTTLYPNGPQTTLLSSAKYKHPHVNVLKETNAS